jgi:hypothetical protein
MYFNEIWYLGVFFTLCGYIQILAKIEQKSKVLYIKMLVHFCGYSECNFLNIYRRENYFRYKLQRKTEHIFYVQYNFFPQALLFQR